ncbi:MAG: HTH-type transcriptional regulator CymR [Firmicutes bacterium ADurb.Bin193]|nr:MAG: HTH-type transcriptional regulator CymR [Firmicutes bacterium ADurb.Bin193]
MRVSTRGRYGLRAMIDIALSDTRAMSLREISGKQDLSEKYLEHIIRRLVKEGLVRSVRGPRGGYVLNKPGDKITVGMVLRAVEGSLSPTVCAEGSCEKEEECAAAYVWHRLKIAIDEVVDSITLEELCKKARE